MTNIKHIKVFHSHPFESHLSFILNSKSYIKSTVEECDIIIHHSISYQPRDTNKLLQQLTTKYISYNKKILLFIIHDFENRYVNFNNIIIVRTSARASKLRPNEIVLPYIWGNPDKPFDSSTINGLPLVGFCGLASKHRKKLIQVFKSSKKVVCDFIIRKKFWAGSPFNTDIVNDFYANINNNQFTLCIRGAGNYSMRFYQVLACGRIPIMVDTDIELPFSDKIPWQEIIVFEKEELMCLNKVIQIHNEGDIASVQQKCREIYNKYFAENVYFDCLVKQIREKKLLDGIVMKNNNLWFRSFIFNIFKK